MIDNNRITVHNIDSNIENISESQIHDELTGELMKLGLVGNEAKILLYLMSHGSSTASDISRNTGIQRTDTYRYISLLLNKGVVLTTFTKPQKYYALSYEEAIDCLLQTKYNSLREIEEKKFEQRKKLDRIVLPSLIKKSTDEGYQVLNGDDVIQAKIRALLGEECDSIIAYLSEKALARLYYAGIIDGFIELSRREHKVKILSPSRRMIEEIKASEKQSSISLQLTGEQIPLSFVVFDQKEVVLLLDNNSHGRQEYYGVCTNNSSLTSTFKYILSKIDVTKELIVSSSDSL